MDDADRCTGRRNLVLGFLAGLCVTGIPLAVLLAQDPAVIVLPAPAAPPSPPRAGSAPGIPVPPAPVERTAAVTATTPADPAPVDPPASAPRKGDEAKDAYADRERKLREGLQEKLDIRVVDAESGAPLRGVDVSVFIGTALSGGCSTGSRTSSEGTLDFGPSGLLEMMTSRWGAEREFHLIGDEEDPLRADVRIRAPGYRPFLAPATGSKLEVRLEKETSPKPLGSLAGRVLGPDGNPWTKSVEVSLQDPAMLDSFTNRVVPDQDGRFQLTGLPPGTWGVKIDDGWGPRVRVDIPPGAMAEVEVKVPDDEAKRANPFPEKRRKVTVLVPERNLPVGGAILLDGEFGAPLRAEVAGGRAEFPAVPVGSVRLILRRPDGADATALAEVPEGDGATEIAFPPPK